MKSIFVRDLGSYLKASREATGLTQKEMSEKFKCHVQFISNVEREKCSIPMNLIKLYVEKCDANPNVVCSLVGVGVYEDLLRVKRVKR